MQQQITAKSIKIKTQLFKRRERVFVLLPASHHADLEKVESETGYVHVLLENDKQEKIFSFAAKIASTTQILPRGSANRMYIEIPLTHRSRVKDNMFSKGSITVIIAPI